MRPRLLHVAALALCAAIIAWSTPARAVEPAPAEEGPSLVSLVPADAGVCIELTDLYRHGQKLTTNPLLARFREFPPLAEWAKENGLGLDEIISRLAQALGVTPDEMGDKLFGRHVILAAWPPEEGDETDKTKGTADPREDVSPSWKEGQGLALVRATDPALVEKLIRVLSGLGQGQPGAAGGPREVTYAGVKYLVRQVPRGDETLQVYFATLGPIGVLTNSQRAMHGVLDLHAKGRTDSLAKLGIYQAAQKRVAADAAIRVFVNPRIWDALMLAQLEKGIEEVEFMGDGLNQLWQAAQFWVASIELDYGLRVDSHVQFDETRVSPELAEVLASLEGSTDALAHIREDSILAGALRVDLGKLAAVFLEGSEGALGEGELGQLDEVRDMARSMFMGMDVIEDILPDLGPDLRVSLHETFDDRNRPAPGWVIGVKTKPRAAGDDRPEVAEVLQSGVGTALQVAATFLNNRFGGQGKKSEVRVDEIAGIKVTSLEGMRFLPAGLVPTFAVNDGYFVFGTSRQAVADTVNVAPEHSLAQLARLRDMLGSRFAAPGQLIYVDCPRLRKILKDQPQLIRFTLGAARGLSTRQVTTSLQRLDEVLALAETIVVAAKFEDHDLAMTLIMSMDVPAEREVVRVAPEGRTEVRVSEPESATP